QVVPPDRQLAFVCVGRCAELVGLFLSRLARVLDIVLEVGPGLSLCGCGTVLCLLGPGSQLRQLIRYGHLNLPACGHRMDRSGPVGAAKVRLEMAPPFSGLWKHPCGTVRTWLAGIISTSRAC